MKPVKPRGTARKLEPWQVAYIRKASALRRKLMSKALAHKFGVSKTTIDHISTGSHKGYCQ